jgi:transposase
MLSVTPGRRIWLCTAPTDMRRSFDGLSAQVKNHLLEDPTNGHWYVFINRRRTQVKLLAFEEGGYCIWSKRLEAGRFAPPSGGGLSKRALCQTEFLGLLEGVELVINRRRKRYKRVA